MKTSQQQKITKTNQQINKKKTSSDDHDNDNEYKDNTQINDLPLRLTESHQSSVIGCHSLKNLPR